MGWTDEILRQKNDTEESNRQKTAIRTEMYNVLTPLVVKLLKELGEALYGRNTIFTKKYILNDWTVARHTYNGYIDENGKIGVVLRFKDNNDVYFDVVRYSGNDYYQDIHSYTENTTEQELQKSLIYVCKGKT